MDSIEVFRFQFGKSDLEHIPSYRLAFIFAAAHAANELNALRMMMVFEARDQFDSEFVKALTSIRWMTLARILLGKVLEFQNLVNGYSGVLRSTGRDTWDKFQIFLRKNPLGKTPSWLGDLRNKVTFHYDAEYVGRLLDGIQDDTTFSFFATKHVGSTAFLFAEEVISFPTIERIAKDKKSADIATGFNTIMEYLSQSVTEVVEFVNSYLLGTLEAYGIPVIEIRDKLDAHFLADPEKTFNPLFILTPLSEDE